MPRIAGFLVVGAIGFAVDACVLAFLVAVTPLGPFAARLVSIAIALAATWLLNRTFTFGPSSRSVAVEGTRYGGGGIATFGAHYLVYSAPLGGFPALPPLFALVVASVAAMTLSFIGYSRLVFDR